MSMSDSNLLLEAKDIELFLPLDLYPQQGMRDAFVRWITKPIDSLINSPEMLHILKGVSIKLHSGDRLAILGVNGAGKSTFCRVISGMYRPNNGKIIAHGEIRAIFDVSTGVMPELTGRENAELLSDLLYPERPLTKMEVNEALEFSELAHFLDAPFKTYSRGMQARLMLSLISQRASDILILDEVFDGADQFFQEKIGKRMSSVIEKSGAVIFVSHSLEQVKRVCNRVVLLEKGKIVFDGSVEEGVQRYVAIHSL